MLFVFGDESDEFWQHPLIYKQVIKLFDINAENQSLSSLTIG